ncbi:hypothetical protein ABZT04_03265 [Streptomyces sp. NPDC005492]|uniref:hypothetical protein n=1 Tax=Streptomyces sp. NPDC005492 TaxID=3156883 RepID=UPI0033A14C0A
MSDGAGRVRRIAGIGVHTRTQTAYQAYLSHRSACESCSEGACETADGLWETYRDANIAADQVS